MGSRCVTCYMPKVTFITMLCMNSATVIRQPDLLGQIIDEGHHHALAHFTASELCNQRPLNSTHCSIETRAKASAKRTSLAASHAVKERCNRPKLCMERLMLEGAR